MTIHERVSCSSFLMGQTVNLFYRIVVILIIITLHSQICKAFQLFQCNYNLNYTKGSKFESNLNTVMNRLVQNTSQTGFNTSEYGQSPDKIYGLLQCMGDTTVDQCHNCSQQANTNLLQNCGNARGGLIWPDNGCFLRYENYSFFGQLDQFSERTFLSNPQNVSSPDVFNRALNSLFTKLSAEAVSSRNRYASGTTIDSLSRKIYALVQCTRDISTDNCSTCLSYTVSYLFAAYAGSLGARGNLASCIVHYEVYTFFKTPVQPPSPAPVADTQRNRTTASSSQKNTSSNKIPLILGVAGGLLLVLLLCVFAARRRLKYILLRRPSEGHENLRLEDEILNLVSIKDRPDSITRGAGR